MLRSRHFSSLALGVMVSVGLVSTVLAHSLEEIEESLSERERYVEVTDRPAPVFTLQDPDGRPVELTDYRDKVVVLWFVYATCPDVCPLQSDAIAGLQEQINSTPMRDLVQFISITTAPVLDTAEALNDYGPAHGLDPANWVFLTSGPGDETATRDLAERYGLIFKPVGDGYQVHGVVTHLIDKSGNLRARYHGLDFEATNFIVHVNALTNDHDHELEADGQPLWQKLWDEMRRRVGLQREKSG